MGRSAALIQAQIDVLETFLASSDSLLQSVSSDGTSRTTITRMDALKELNILYQVLGRANGTSPMIARGVVKGL